MSKAHILRERIGRASLSLHSDLVSIYFHYGVLCTLCGMLLLAASSAVAIAWVLLGYVLCCCVVLVLCMILLVVGLGRHMLKS